MATIASLNINLNANSADFNAGLAKGGKSLGAFAAAVEASGTGVGRWSASIKGQLSGVVAAFAKAKAAIVAVGAAIAASAVVRGVVTGYAETAEAIDKVAKESDRLGIATEQLVGLQHAANLSGVSAEQLTGGLEKMLKTLADAATKGGDAEKTLRAMGLAGDELVNIDPGEAFRRIADGLNAIENPAQRAAAVVAIFGKSGQSLLPLLAEGSDGLAAMQAEAEKLGLTFSRVDAAQIEEANDAISRMGAAWEGIKRQLAIAIAPGVQLVSQHLGEAVAWVKDNLVPSFDTLAEISGFILDLWDGVVGTFKALQLSALAVARAMADLGETAGLFDSSNRLGIEAEMQRLAKEIESMGGNAEKIKAKFGQMREEAAAAAGPKGIGQFVEAVEEAKEKAEKIKPFEFKQVGGDTRTAAFERRFVNEFTTSGRQSEANKLQRLAEKQLREAQRQSRILTSIDRREAGSTSSILEIAG